MAELGTGATIIKYILFVFNVIFLLAGLALIIIGAIVQVQANKTLVGNSTSGAGIFLIVIGSIVFLVCFFGCAGAINNNYCMVLTYGILLIIILLLQIAAVITGFVLKNELTTGVKDELLKTQKQYDNNTDTFVTKSWDDTQQKFHCCGSYGYQSWNESEVLSKQESVPDSCCVNGTHHGCGIGKNKEMPGSSIYKKGCNDQVIEELKSNVIAVGGAAAGVAVLEVLGIIFAFCLAHNLRKDYRVV